MGTNPNLSNKKIVLRQFLHNVMEFGLFKKYVAIPLLENCCQLWNPWKAKDIQAIEAVQRTHIQNHWSTALKLLGKTARTQIVLSPEKPWTLYCAINLDDNKAYMVPNIGGTIGHTIKTWKHPRHGTQCVIQHPTNRNPGQSHQENAITVFGPRFTTRCQNIWDISKCWN